MSFLPKDPTEKIQIAKEKKEVADQAFKKGDLQVALLNYHEALMHLHGLDKNALTAMGGSPATPYSIPTSTSAADSELKSDGVKDSEKKAEEKKEEEKLSEIDDLLVKIYSNQCACQIKKGNWKRAVETADKALAKSPKNWKVMFRKGKALGESGYVEKALKVLEECEALEGADKTSIQAEISRIKAADKEREKKHNQKFKGFLNKGARGVSYDSTPTASSTTSIQSTDSAFTNTSTASVASKASTVPGTGLSPTLDKTSLKAEDTVVPKPLEPSGLVEVSEEEFERAKKGRE